MKLRLNRPIVFFDLETTGLDVTRDRIIEAAFVKVTPDGSREVLSQKINPGVEVSKGAAKVTGINTDWASGLFWGPPLKKVGAQLVAFLDGCDLGGFNSQFYDLPLWIQECRRHGIPFDPNGRHHVDVKVIFHAKETGWDRFLMGPRNLTAAVRHYCGRDLDGAHQAETDVQATVDVLLAQLERYPDLPCDVAGLHEFCARQNPDEVAREGMAS